jgi:hypothetical protein
MTRKLSILLVFVCASFARGQSSPAAHVDHPGLKKLGWQLACQMSTFRDRTVFETLDFLHAQGFHHVELSPGQVLSSEKKEVKIGPDMSPADIDALLTKLKEVHLDVVSYGVVDSANLRSQMEFARKLKAKNMVVRGSLPEDAEKIAEELRVKIAVLGDPLEKLPAGDRTGRCVDLTHDPDQLTDRVIEVHLGEHDSMAALTRLKLQKFKGVFAVESHDGQGNPLETKFVRAVNTFSDEVTKLAQ